MSKLPDNNEEKVAPRMKKVLVFTPVLRSLIVDLNNTMGGQLATIFHSRGSALLKEGLKVVLNKNQNRAFVEGVAAARVMQADRLLQFLDIADFVEIELKEVEDK